MALKDIITDTISEYLRDPLAFPEEFRSWVPEWTETVGIVTPRSQVTGLYTTADSIGDLGEPAHGRPCMLRVGSDPYDFVQMTFDEIANLWVSTQTWVTPQIEQHAPAGTSYADLTISGSNWDQAVATITYVGDKITAGLKPQVSVAGKLASHAAGTMYLQAALLEYDVNDTSTSVGATGGEISIVNTTTATFKASDWVNMTVSSLTKKYALLSLQSKYASAAPVTGVINGSASFRWVADPA